MINDNEQFVPLVNSENKMIPEFRFFTADHPLPVLERKLNILKSTHIYSFYRVIWPNKTFYIRAVTDSKQHTIIEECSEDGTVINYDGYYYDFGNPNILINPDR